MPGYVLREAEGRSYRWSPAGYLFTVKARIDEVRGEVAFMEFATEKGMEPPSHVHEGEDEIFYVLSGELTVACGDDSLEAGPGDFVFLPSGVRHSYKIRSDGLVHLLVLTVNREGDGRRFGRDIEETGERVDADTVRRYMDDLRAR
jgi:quercetin dioxygenase-like cupin family protein